MTLRLLISISLLAVSGGYAMAATIPPGFQANPLRLNPPPGVVVPADVRSELTAGAEALGKEIDRLRSSLHDKPALAPLLPDVQIYHNAVRYALADDIFTNTNQFKTARHLLEEGLTRAQQLAEGNPAWNTKSGLLELKRNLETKGKDQVPPPLTHVPVARGYTSRIDGSIQPYGILVPVTYIEGDNRPRRLDFWLHGRGDTLNEIAFIEGRERPGSEFLPEDTFILHPYGRFMNAFKFAGETDVFEALENATTHYPIDRKKLSMRGFSMGGAGAWHLGAHHPDRFAVVNPGAGFVDVLNYQKLGSQLTSIPWWEQKLWALYDPLACPMNLMNTTLIAYSGENDAQKAAADLMEAALLREGRRMTHVIGPQTGHKYEPEARKVVARLVDQAVTVGIDSTPTNVTLTTHTLQFNRAHWLTVEALEQHWKVAKAEARVIRDGESSRIEIKTLNVTALSVSIVPASIVGKSATLVIDGQSLGRRPTVFSNPPPGQPASWWRYSATKTDGQWTESGPYADTRLAKRPGLQGPIDHAFMDSFIIVRPTGAALNERAHQWITNELSEAKSNWRRFFRGEPRVKTDREITEDDIRNNNLAIWGDPASNDLLTRIADKLPIRWTRRWIVVDNKTYDSSKHIPVFIYPNPLNPKRYVVINSGFTFPQFAADSNSLQTPKLPDWAILDLDVSVTERIRGKGVVDANFFDEHWELKPSRP